MQCFMRCTLLIVVAMSSSLRAEASLVESPCRRCTLDVPLDATDPAPLVVVLHGDNDSARERAMKWRPAIEQRGWALLSLECPRELGCPEGSWYKWDHDASWVLEQVRDVIATYPIDPSRVYLVGWSGGATFIGQHLPAWSSVFAATVIHGGGVQPRSQECPDRPFPAYFLVGDANPAHGGMKRLRAYFEDCGQEVRWDLLRGANHEREDTALTPQKANEILSWLAARTSAPRAVTRTGFFVREKALSAPSRDASL
jgi:poly(3-hydroxybutyrate) depolymerase